MLGIATATKAQTFTQHLQQKQQGKASVVVTQSREIEELVNNANVSARAQEPVKKLNQYCPPIIRADPS